MTDNLIQIETKQQAQTALEKLCSVSVEKMHFSPIEKVDDLILKGASFTAKNKSGIMPIERAAIAGNRPVVALFAARGGQFNKHVSVLYHSVMNGHAQLSSLIYNRMSVWGRLKAHSFAASTGKGKEFRNALRVCRSKYPEKFSDEWKRVWNEMSARYIAPDINRTIKDSVGALLSVTRKKRRQYKELLTVKKEMKKSMAVGKGDSLVPLFLDAVYSQNPLVVDYLYTYGDIFFVPEKAFASVPKKDEAKFMEKWVLVTDDVTEIRHGRHQEYVWRRVAQQNDPTRKLMRTLKNTLKGQMYTQTKTVPLKKLDKEWMPYSKMAAERGDSSKEQIPVPHQVHYIAGRIRGAQH